MVHFAGSGSRRRRTEKVLFEVGSPVKLEYEDSSKDEHGHFNKRMKHSSVPDHRSSAGNDLLTLSPSQYNPLDEPSPLGLRLRKSPSLLELIQMRLSQGNASKLGSEPDDNVNLKEKSSTKGTAGPADKLKAANFPASLLKIGGWEYASRYEGDLVAKCYFAKHKLVWEILDGGLKSKIEIQWSDIMGLKANISEDGPATLTVVLVRQPLFFRETNPQPRKHTLWQATADFTDGHASLHRQHFLQVPHGLLNKHFEKLIQCDARLNFLSLQPEIVLDSPYFDAQAPIFNHSDEAENLGLDPRESSKGHNISAFQDVGSPTMSQSSSITIKQEDIVGRATDNISHEAPSPSSVMEMHAVEVTGPVDGNLKNSKGWEHLIMQGLRPSMSMSDLVNHIGSYISGQASSQNPSIIEEGSVSHEMLEDLTQYLLSDSQYTACSDEKSLMSRVNSLCCLLQDSTPVRGVQLTGESSFIEPEGGKNPPLSFHNTELMHQNPTRIDGASSGVDGHDFSNFKPAPAMSRKDSFSDLLLHLPRIASLPKFWLDIAEDGQNKAR
ncbi:hypothetical protein Dimus_025784 [Dionaea muscipula]